MHDHRALPAASAPAVLKANVPSVVIQSTTVAKKVGRSSPSILSRGGNQCKWQENENNWVYVDTRGEDGQTQMGYLSMASMDGYTGQPQITPEYCRTSCERMGSDVCGGAQVCMSCVCVFIQNCVSLILCSVFTGLIEYLTYDIMPFYVFFLLCRNSSLIVLKKALPGATG